jgi:hypothetical protein
MKTFWTIYMQMCERRYMVLTGLQNLVLEHFHIYNTLGQGHWGIVWLYHNLISFDECRKLANNFLQSWA